MTTEQISSTEKKNTDIRLENVSYIYSPDTPFRKVALDDVSLTIHGGVITGLMGHTGSGKSTLVQLLNGLNKPTSGKVFVGGDEIWADPKKVSSFAFRVGLVFQYPEYQLFEETVRKDIEFGPGNMGLDEQEIARRVADFGEILRNRGRAARQIAVRSVRRAEAPGRYRRSHGDGAGGSGARRAGGGT